MSDNLERALFIVAELFLFIVACMFTIDGMQGQEKAIDTFRHAAEQEERRLFTSLEVNGRETYTGAEVLQSIYQIHVLGANIRVGNQTFFYKDLDLETLDVSGIDLRRTYDVTYIRDSNGTVQTIVFT
jgi:hypothetical protein